MLIRRGEAMKIKLFVNWVLFLKTFGTNLRKESQAPREILHAEALKAGFRTSGGPAATRIPEAGHHPENVVSVLETASF